MTSYLMARLWQSLILLLLVSVIGFAALNLAPGGPLSQYVLTPGMTQEALDRIAEKMGLNRPLPIQYLDWLWHLVRGDWGKSYRDGQPVLSIIASHLGATLLLMGTSTLLSIVIGTWIGIKGATKRYSIFDYAATVGAMVALSIPTFWFGLVAIYLFALKLKWLPAGNMYTVGDGSLGDYLIHLILPSVVLALVNVAVWSRYMRTATLDVINQDFVRTAKAKGLSPRRVLMKHVVGNALLPMITLAGLQVPAILGGALVTETVFTWPGMGRLFLDSLGYNDYPVVMGLLMFSAIFVLAGNLLADLAVAFIDPAFVSVEESAMSPTTTIVSPATQPRWWRNRTLRRFARHRLAIVGVAMIALPTLACVAGPWLLPFDELHIDLRARFSPPLTGSHIFGTDPLGRDLAARLFMAGRISLLVGFFAMLLSTVFGTIIGVTAGYYGGRTGAFLMRFVDAFLAFPSIFLLLALAAFIKPSPMMITVIIAVTSWMEVARIVEAEIRSLRERDFVLAARMLGLSNGWIMFRELLPNVMGPIIVAATLTVARAILLEAYVSFLGYGIQPPLPSWGNMLNGAQQYLASAPWLAIVPGIAITLAVTSFNFIGDGLRDALDARGDLM